jgi:hypothetical protein
VDENDPKCFTFLSLNDFFDMWITHSLKRYMCSRNCGISNGYCLHFSPRLPSKMQNQRNEEIYNAALQTLLMKIRGTTIPGLLDSTVKGTLCLRLKDAKEESEFVATLCYLMLSCLI